MTAPASYQGAPVPPDIAARWNRWEGAEWRRMRWVYNNNRFDYPDQRFGVYPPAGMCLAHLEMRRGYRDMHFNTARGYRWPGTPVLEWSVIPGKNIFAERRTEWDEKAGEQMRLIEELCLSGRSPQCDERACAACGLRRPDAEWLAWIDSPLPPGHVRAQRREHRCMCETFGEWQPADG
jgi:hypothetical protein